jgi:hypothetical protein
MEPAYKARSLGLRLGAEQRLEHDRLLPRPCLGEGSLEAVAVLAWAYEKHGLPDTPYLRRCFTGGYVQGYRLGEAAGAAGHPRLITPRSASAATKARSFAS